MLTIVITFCVSFALSQACGHLNEVQSHGKGRHKEKPLTLQWLELVHLLVAAIVRSCQLIPKIWTLLATLWRHEYVEASDVSFFAYSPEDVVTCQSYQLSRLCGNRVSSDEREEAAELRQSFGTVAPDTETFDNMFSRYTELCMCTQDRQKNSGENGNSKNNPRFNAKIAAWKRELRDLYRHHVTTAKGSHFMPGGFPSSQCPSPTERDTGLGVPQAYSDLFRGKSECEHECEDLSSNRQGRLFEPYTRAVERSLYLWEDIRDKLMDKDKKPGWIYVYRRRSLGAKSVPSDVNVSAPDTMHLKIGYTTGSTQKRMTKIRNECAYETEIVFEKEVPHAKRVERLIHAELEIEGRRRIDNHCRFNKQGCSTTHGEWFEVDEQHARRVCEHWCSWMIQHQPYAANGRLQKRWVVDRFRPTSEIFAAIAEAATKGTSISSLSFHYNSQGVSWYVRPGDVSPVRLCNAEDVPLQSFSGSKTEGDSRRRASANTVQLPRTPAAASRARSKTPRKTPRKTSALSLDIPTPPPLSASSSSSSVPQRDASDGTRTPSPFDQCVEMTMIGDRMDMDSPRNGFEDSPMAKRGADVSYPIIIPSDDEEMIDVVESSLPKGGPSLFTSRDQLASSHGQEMLSLGRIDAAVREMGETRIRSQRR